MKKYFWDKVIWNWTFKNWIFSSKKKEEASVSLWMSLSAAAISRIRLNLQRMSGESGKHGIVVMSCIHSATTRLLYLLETTLLVSQAWQHHNVFHSFISTHMCLSLPLPQWYTSNLFHNSSKPVLLFVNFDVHHRQSHFTQFCAHIILKQSLTRVQQSFHNVLFAEWNMSKWFDSC